MLLTSRSMLRVCYQHERANLLRLGLIVEQRPESSGHRPILPLSPMQPLWQRIHLAIRLDHL